MDDPGLLAVFGAALGPVPPWQVVAVEFDKDAGTLEIGLDFPRGSRFACPEGGCSQSACPVHDTTGKRWRHLDFFEHQAFLSARVPRANCAEHGVHLVAVPWARPGSGFTLLMEIALLTFAAEMPVAPLSRMARTHDTRIWRVLEHHVGVARGKLDFSGVARIGTDETSARRGQDYLSPFMDFEQRRVMFATEGKDADTVKAFAEDLAAYGGSPRTQIDTVCYDTSTAFQRGITEHLCEQEPTEEEQAAALSPAEQVPTEAAAQEDGAPPDFPRCRHFTSPRSSSTAISWSRRPTRRSMRSGEPSRSPVPSRAQAIPLCLAEERGEPDRQAT